MPEETRLVSWRNSRWSVTVISEDLLAGADTVIIAVVVATGEMEVVATRGGARVVATKVVKEVATKVVKVVATRDAKEVVVEDIKVGAEQTIISTVRTVGPTTNIAETRVAVVAAATGAETRVAVAATGVETREDSVLATMMTAGRSEGSHRGAWIRTP